MVEAGQAFAYRRYRRQCDAQEYLQLEEEAKRQCLGIWSIGPSGITRPWDYRKGRRSSASSSGITSKYRCKEIGLWNRAQQLLAQGHRYLDGDGDGEACESLKLFRRLKGETLDSMPISIVVTVFSFGSLPPNLDYFHKLTS